VKKADGLGAGLGSDEGSRLVRLFVVAFLLFCVFVLSLVSVWLVRRWFFFYCDVGVECSS
jgi:hypothetical protein